MDNKEKNWEETQKKIDELAEVMRQGRHNGEIMRLPSESQARAAELQERAVQLIEEITGEKWEFSYLTW